jgi:hypothetical protein
LPTSYTIAASTVWAVDDLHVPWREEMWDRTADPRAEAVLFIELNRMCLTEHIALSDKILTIRRQIILQHVDFDENYFDEQFLDHLDSEYPAVALFDSGHESRKVTT